MIESNTITDWIDSLAPMFDRGAASAQRIDEGLYTRYMAGVAGMTYVLEDLRDAVELIELPNLKGYKFTSDQVNDLNGHQLIVQHKFNPEDRNGDTWLCWVPDPPEQYRGEGNVQRIAILVSGKEIRRQIRNGNAERIEAV